MAHTTFGWTTMGYGWWRFWVRTPLMVGPFVFCEEGWGTMGSGLCGKIKEIMGWKCFCVWEPYVSWPGLWIKEFLEWLRETHFEQLILIYFLDRGSFIYLISLLDDILSLMFWFDNARSNIIRFIKKHYTTRLQCYNNGKHVL